MTDYEGRLIKELNSVVVTVDELAEILQELDQRHDSGTAEEGDGMYLITCKFAGQPERGQAIYFRMEALAKIIRKRGAPGWTMPSRPDRKTRMYPIRPARLCCCATALLCTPNLRLTTPGLPRMYWRVLVKTYRALSFSDCTVWARACTKSCWRRSD